MLSATIRQPLELTGRGLFSGQPCRAMLRPAPFGSGLALLHKDERVPLTPDHIVEQPSCTVIGDGDFRVAVVEHLLAALWAAGIDTTELICHGPEIPNQDGSALPIFEAIAAAGRQELDSRPELHLSRPLRVEEGESFIQLDPAQSLQIEYHFDHPELGQQSYRTDLRRELAAQEILPARSFITKDEADHARARGFLRNDNAEDALVMQRTENGAGWEPVSALRFDNEFARHKVLDFLGDLYLLPFEWNAHVTAHRSGHRLNRMLARELWRLYRPR